ncbi:MAG TPA: riboflavin biosynthesis protein RibF [Holophagaceae bacterium]|nr:riboflavin biosynthesis protein RibF [Holophagaceae bacterium]
MEVWHHGLEAAAAAGPSVVTLGNFDGVHAGHLEVLAEAARRAKARDLRAAVVTFDPHPTVVVAPERRPRLLMTLAQRLKAFEAAGMDLAWVIPFSRAFSELSPDTFLEGLGRALAPVELHVGRAFSFGRDRSGTVETLEAWGQRVGCEVHAHALRAPDGGHLSSTRIRQDLDAGEVEAAAQLLGHPYILSGVVVEGDRRGRHLGFPTANLAWEQEQLPAGGVYVVEVRGAHLGPRLGLCNVGEKPTFSGRMLTVETFIPGFEGDLYGARLELAFAHRIRGERRFDGPEALRAQIAQDVAQGEAWWKAHRG